MSRAPQDLYEDVPAADFQTRAEGLLEQVQTTGRPVVVTRGGQKAAVLVDFESYRSLVDEVGLLRDVHQGLADIDAGRVVPHEEALARLLDRYK